MTTQIQTVAINKTFTGKVVKCFATPESNCFAIILEDVNLASKAIPGWDVEVSTNTDQYFVYGLTKEIAVGTELPVDKKIWSLKLLPNETFTNDKGETVTYTKKVLVRK